MGVRPESKSCIKKTAELAARKFCMSLGRGREPSNLRCSGWPSLTVEVALVLTTSGTCPMVRPPKPGDWLRSSPASKSLARTKQACKLLPLLSFSDRELFELFRAEQQGARCHLVELSQQLFVSSTLGDHTIKGLDHIRRRAIRRR